MSLPGEWRAALAWIDGCGLEPAAISVIPGNHDAYVESVVASRAFERLFAPYMTSDLAPRAAPASAPTIPTSSCATSSRSSACPARSRPAISARGGMIGDAQLARLEAVLAAPELARQDARRADPPPARAAQGRRRRETCATAPRWRRCWRASAPSWCCTATITQDERAELRGPGGRPIPVIGAGSASYTGGPERRSRYSVYEIDGSSITWVTRAHDEATDAFREVRREQLA